MRYLTQSAFNYVRDQINQQPLDASQLMLIMPSVPPRIVTDLGDRLTRFCAESERMISLTLRVSAPLFAGWESQLEAEHKNLVQQVRGNGWYDEGASLTAQRNAIPSGPGLHVLVLMGADKVTDASSLADFHHCDFRVIWQQELQGSFISWVRTLLQERNVGFERDSLQHWDSILLPLYERGLADLLDISTFLEELDLRAAQDGRDAEKVLLSSLARFDLPLFRSFTFGANRSFGPYVDDAVAFFSYSVYLDDARRERAKKAIQDFAHDHPSGGTFDPSERGRYASDMEFLADLLEYVRTGDRVKREKLIKCDFVVIRDKILKYRSRVKKPAPEQSTLRLSGAPVDVVLTALWVSLGDFTTKAEDRGLRISEILTHIDISTVLFKHDSDGDTSEVRSLNAREYLARLLGGVDQFLKRVLDSVLGEHGSTVRSHLVGDDVDCRSSRTAEPLLIFRVLLRSENEDTSVDRRFAWRLPETHSYRVAEELISWAATAVKQAPGYCLPVYHVPYYEELLLAKDEEEARRVLLHCIHEDSDGPSNLLSAREFDHHDYLASCLKDLAADYDAFLQYAKEKGLHAALFDKWDELRKSYEGASAGYLEDAQGARSPLATLLFRAFLLLKRRPESRLDQWVWQEFEPSGVATILHPAVLELLQARLVYVSAAFAALVKQGFRSSDRKPFRPAVWQSYLDLATIQMPLTGLLRDVNRVLDTNVRGDDLIHRIGLVSQADTPLTTRLLLRYEGADEEDLTDTELFRRSRASLLLSRIFHDYWALHPHAHDGLSVAVYMDHDIQPLIAALDQFLGDACADRTSNDPPYSLTVTVLTESSEDASVTQWIAQWKDRWAAAENEDSLSRYRYVSLSLAHRIVSPENDYQQFRALIADGLHVDIAILQSFIRAGTDGSLFEVVDAYDVTSRTLKFPILEKSFCSLSDPGRRLQRARVLSNRQFRLSTYHAEFMARLKNHETPQHSQHVVLGYGDYSPWIRVVDELHHRAEWVVCIDPNIDDRLVAEKATDRHEVREIIGFGSGVGAHGEANYTISTEQFRFTDIENLLCASVAEVYAGWTDDTYHAIAKSIMKETRHVSGLSLVRATGIGDYIRDFMAYALCRKLLHPSGDPLCDQLISLDAYRHWFDSAESEMRPDLVWMVVRLSESGRLRLEMSLIECKLAMMSDAHLNKAHEQLEHGLDHLVRMFMPKVSSGESDDDRPDQRYWWLQLHRLIASKAEIRGSDQRKVLSALERLSEGDFDVSWSAAAFTFWTDQDHKSISQNDVWPHRVDETEIEIAVLSCGTEFVRSLCEGQAIPAVPWAPIHDEPRINPGMRSPTTPGVERPDQMYTLSVERDAAQGGANRIPDGDEKPKDPKEYVPNPPTAISEPIPERIWLGKALGGGRDVFWEFGNPDLNNRHVLLFGSSGMGKTYTIQCLLFELGRNHQNSLIIDYTNGFHDNHLEPEFSQLLRPVQHVIRKRPLDINPFRQQGDIINGEFLPEPASTTAQRVSGVFSGVYRFGDQQKSALYQVIKSVIEDYGERAMTLDVLIPMLEEMAEQKSVVGQSSASVASKIRPFVDQKPFGFEKEGGWDALLGDKEHRCHIIQLAGLLKDAARLVTEFSLLDLYWFYRSRSTQRSPHVVVLDEVQNLDHREESPLAQMLREGRKFGFSLILATQTMSNLEREERDRLFNAAHKLFFRPADTEMKSFAEIAAISTGEKTDVWVERLAGLTKGECYSIGPSLNGSTGRLEVKAFRIRIASLSQRTANV